MLQVTSAQKKQAVELAKKHSVKELFMNNNGEFFTAENLAAISVGGKKELYAKIETSYNEASGLNSKKADELIPLIATIESVEELQSILDAENADKKRSTVITAIEERVKELKAE
jgi:hypothetical protein